MSFALCNPELQLKLCLLDNYWVFQDTPRCLTPSTAGERFLLSSISKMFLVSTVELSRRKVDMRLLRNRVYLQRPHPGTPPPSDRLGSLRT